MNLENDVKVIYLTIIPYTQNANSARPSWVVNAVKKNLVVHKI